MNSFIDIKSKLAGMNAMCTANPYPVFTIGDGVNTKFIKHTADRENALEDNLNPEFLRQYELDARLPEDWKLEIAFYDKRNMKQLD